MAQGEGATDEKREAFEKWLENREKRKVANTAKRAAIKQLIENHKAEYEKLVKAAK